MTFALISKGEIVKLKFQLLNIKDSTEISMARVKIKPIKSYYVEEGEHHQEGAVEHNFKKFRFYYDKESLCIIFEFNYDEYPYDDIYLRLESDSFYYDRPLESDYDERDHIWLNVNENRKFVKKVFLFPYRFINIVDSGTRKSNDCIKMYIYHVIEQDTIYNSKSFVLKKNTYVSGVVLKTVALPQDDKYLLYLEIFSNGKYIYCYYDLSVFDKAVQTLYLKDLNYIESESIYKDSDYVRFSEYAKRKKHIEYYGTYTY